MYIIRTNTVALIMKTVFVIFAFILQSPAPLALWCTVIKAPFFFFTVYVSDNNV